MPHNPETQALLEQAIGHVLSQQKRLLARNDISDFVEVCSALCSLAADSHSLLISGGQETATLARLAKRAIQIDELIDEVSERRWEHVPVSIAAIYHRVQEAPAPADDKKRLRSNVRSHYHNLRIRLLNQTLGARMLRQSSDLGEEVERIWQQFLERELGSNFRVLRGGHVFDHQGNSSKHQIDLIVVPSNSVVISPGDSDGGKVNVFINDVVAVLMVTSNLTVDKLREDWRKLCSIPSHQELASDYPHLEASPWPLRYIVGAQSDTAEELAKVWREEGQSCEKHQVPQFALSLDGSFLYSGAATWPRPQYPGNYTRATQVAVETGTYSGLGLAWLVAQIKGRLAAIENRSMAPVNRFKVVLDDASLKPSMPPTFSARFISGPHFQEIAGLLRWGQVSLHPHNRLELTALTCQRRDGDGYLEFRTQDDYRWFRSDKVYSEGSLAAFEEWTQPKSPTMHSKRIAVFESNTGNEIHSAELSSLERESDIRQALRLRLAQ